VQQINGRVPAAELLVKTGSWKMDNEHTSASKHDVLAASDGARARHQALPSTGPTQSDPLELAGFARREDAVHEFSEMGDIG
jgi:hypothetical protein